MKRGMIRLSLLFFLVMPCTTTAADWLEQTSQDAKRNLEIQRQHGGFYPNSPGPGPSGQGSGGQPSGQGSGGQPSGQGSGGQPGGQGSGGQPGGQGSGGQPGGQGSGGQQPCPPGYFFADSPFGQGKCMPKSK